MTNIDKALESSVEVTSKKFLLNAKDFLRGLLIAMGTASLMVIQTSIDAGQLVLQWKSIVMAGCGGGFTYLLKNYFQPAQIKQTITNTQVDEIKKVVPTEPAAK